MKKTLTFVLTILMVLALAAPSMAAVEKVGAKSDTITAAVAGVGSKAPVLDGKVSANEYQEIKYTADDMRYKGADDAYLATLQNANFKMYAAYSKDTMYVAVVVDTPNYSQTQTAEAMFKEYSCQVSGAKADEATAANRFEYGFAKSSADNKLMFYSYSDFYKSEWNADTTGKDFVVVTDKNVTTYEMAIPAKSFGVSSFNKGDKVRMNICMNMGSSVAGDKKNGQIEWSQGCGGKKNSTQFAVVTLGDAIASATTTTPASPKTADPVSLIMASVVASAAAFVVAKKKH